MEEEQSLILDAMVLTWWHGLQMVTTHFSDGTHATIQAWYLSHVDDEATSFWSIPVWGNYPGLLELAIWQKRYGSSMEHRLCNSDIVNDMRIRLIRENVQNKNETLSEREAPDDDPLRLLAAAGA